MNKRKMLTLFFLVASASIKAQVSSLYSFNELSSVYYAKQIDSLKKALVAPSIYKKNTQKKYEEFWNERVEAITSNLKSNQYVYNSEIYKYVSAILNEILIGNKTLIPQTPMLLLDRSTSINAYTYGFNIIALNMGMLDFAKSREELAFILSHELSHNILNHALNADKKRAEWITSKEYEDELNKISNSEYQKFTQLKNLFNTFTFTRTRHSRYNESGADSLAIILLKNAKMPFNANWLLRLDSSDNIYKTDLKRDVSAYFKDYNIDISSTLFEKKSSGLSAKAYNFKDTSKLQDSLKTHPDCIERYKSTLSQNTNNIVETAISSNIKETAKKIMLWNLFDDNHLTACTYRIFLEKDKGNTDPWYDFLLNNIMFGFVYHTKQFKRFNVINIKPKEIISKKYYQLQTMYEQVSLENLESYYKDFGKTSFWNNLTAQERSFKDFVTELISKDLTPKEVNRLAENFIQQNNLSYLQEFANHFSKK